jgi:hypothetical protein
MKRVSKRFLYIFSFLVLLLIVAYFGWQKYKYKIINNSLAATVAEQTDSLYMIQYDSLHFDAVAGSASIKNVRIVPDTNRIKKMALAEQPDILLNVTIKSVMINGVKTAKALQGDKMEGDSVIIQNPEITLYSIKPLKKSTLIQNEATELYRQLLGNLNRIKVGFVFINGVNVKGIDFFTKRTNFDFINGNFVLQDVLIDSAHHLDTNRVLFCKQAAFTVDSFFSYNRNREQMAVKKVHFLGKQKLLLFDQIAVNRFANETSLGIRLIDAKKLVLKGLNSNEVVKNKNLLVDTILCNDISLYQLPVENLKTNTKKTAIHADTTGFMNVYSVHLNHLSFPKFTFVPFAESNYSLGNISIEVNGVSADRLIDWQNHPMDYTKEVEVLLDKFSVQSKDKLYHFNFNKIGINSLHKNFTISSFDIVPFAAEKQFANHFHFQKDRYQVSLSGITLSDIDMNGLLDKRLEASQLVIQNAAVKIYRDLHKPLEQKSKVGNYPSQLLLKLSQPLNIQKATINNANIEYDENETVSDKTGVISFANSNLTITNITNIPSVIQKNDRLNIAFNSRVLGSIPISGNFVFSLKNNNGDFTATGHLPEFDALQLNKISLPMALIKISSGKINAIDFHFTGNNTTAKGDFVMKYQNLKVDVLKRDKTTHDIKKRGLATLAANLLVANNNPTGAGLRKETPEYHRDIYKSFFNLLWKTIFTGMKQTVGIP